MIPIDVFRQLNIPKDEFRKVLVSMGHTLINITETIRTQTSVPEAAIKAIATREVPLEMYAIIKRVMLHHGLVSEHEGMLIWSGPPGPPVLMSLELAEKFAAESADEALSESEDLA